MGEVFRELASHRECQIHEGHLMGDHVHMLISIPPKYSDSQVVGYIKGKSAIHIARTYMGRRRNFRGQSFWARGYYASTVGRDEQSVRDYIRNQEEFDRRIDQLSLFGWSATFRWLTINHRFERFTVQSSGFAGGH